MDINNWKDTWGTVDWEHDPEDTIKQKITDLYNAGVDFNMENAHDGNKMPLAYAARYSTPKIIDLLIGGGANPNFDELEKVMTSIDADKAENLKCLLNHGTRDFVSKYFPTKWIKC